MEEKTRKRSALRIFFRTCSGCLLQLLLAVLIVVLIIVIIALLNYKNWENKNAQLFDSFKVNSPEVTISKSNELDSKLAAFQESTIQKESLELDCSLVEILVENAMIESGHQVGRDEIGVVCGQRTLDIYVKVGHKIWTIYKVWQRADDSVDFVVYDVMLGPVSLSNNTFGYVTSEMNNGIKDALNLVLTNGFPGREIEEMYVKKEGIRIVGTKQAS